MSSDTFLPLLRLVAQGTPLSSEQAENAFEDIMSGQLSPLQIAAFLTALHVRGESTEELTAAARIMRRKATPVHAPDTAIDIVGTGGDSLKTLNISTAAAFITAGAGVPVAKHGNKAVSSLSGAADILNSLDINLHASIPIVEQALQDAKIAFLMAPLYHSAMKYVAPIRADLGLRTIFNLLGPLTNPASVRAQLSGVFAPKWLLPFAQTLKELGVQRAWVVHGSDGMDELTLTGTSEVVELKDGKINSFILNPQDYGLTLCTLEDLQGGTPEHNAQALKEMLEGKESPYLHAACLNSAAALVVAQKVGSLQEGLTRAYDSVQSGQALEALNKLVALTNGKV